MILPIMFRVKMRENDEKMTTNHKQVTNNSQKFIFFLNLSFFLVLARLDKCARNVQVKRCANAEQMTTNHIG